MPSNRAQYGRIEYGGLPVKYRICSILLYDNDFRCHSRKHLDAQSIMMRLRWLGINLLGARNSALGNLVAEVPPPLGAELLGYSYPSHSATR
jgi:hypothetical protein